jgi:SAM-dependent methyltransferase
VKTYAYNDDFMQYAAKSSAYSAVAVTSILYRQLKVNSVLDIGCAMGTWLRAWGDCGVVDLHGVDGTYINRRALEVPPGMFTAVDLSDSFDLGRQFDLVQSLEVGEHIKKSASETFVENIARHARAYVLFSAAPPGQGGEHHINEQPYEFWRAKFEARGFVTVDAVRPSIVRDKRISYWYRYNSVLFVRRERFPDAHDDMRATLLMSHDPIKDLSSLPFRFRKAIVRRLPHALQDKIARLKSKFLPTGQL